MAPRFQLFDRMTRFNRTDAIDVIDYFGYKWRIMGPGEGEQGVWLAPKSTGLFDMPIKTNWGPGMFGQKFRSWKPQRRDVVWTVYIANPEDNAGIDDDPDTWHSIYSRWKAGVRSGYPITIVYTSVDGERRLTLTPLESPKSVNTLEFEGTDPHLWPFGSVVNTCATTELPFYVGATEVFEWESPANFTGSTWFYLPYYNPATVDCWAEWEVSAEATWTLPDYSFGSQEYARGLQDEGKTVKLTPLIYGEDCIVQCRPDLETLIAANDNPVGNRMGGRDFEYPIPPGAGDPEKGCVVLVQDIANGASCRLKLSRWHEEPFGQPLVVRP
jgi:hypothetical protein